MKATVLAESSLYFFNIHRAISAPAMSKDVSHALFPSNIIIPLGNSLQSRHIIIKHFFNISWSFQACFCNLKQNFMLSHYWKYMMCDRYIKHNLTFPALEADRYITTCSNSALITSTDQAIGFISFNEFSTSNYCYRN